MCDRIQEISKYGIVIFMFKWSKSWGSGVVLIYTGHHAHCTQGVPLLFRLPFAVCRLLTDCTNSINDLPKTWTFSKKISSCFWCARRNSMPLRSDSGMPVTLSHGGERKRSAALLVTQLFQPLGTSELCDSCPLQSVKRHTRCQNTALKCQRASIKTLIP